MTTLLSAIVIGMAYAVFYGIYLMSVRPYNLHNKLRRAQKLEAEDSANIFCKWGRDQSNRKKIVYKTTAVVGMTLMEEKTDTNHCGVMQNENKRSCEARREAWEEVADAAIQEQRLFQQIMFHFYGAAPPSGYFAAFGMYLVCIFFATAFDIIFKKKDQQRPIARVIFGSCYISITQFSDANILFAMIGVLLAIWGFMGPTLIPAFQLLTELCQLALGSILNAYYYISGSNSRHTTQEALDYNLVLNRHIGEFNQGRANITKHIYQQIESSVHKHSLPRDQDAVITFDYLDTHQVWECIKVVGANDHRTEEPEDNSNTNGETDSQSDSSGGSSFWDVTGTLRRSYRVARTVHKIANTPFKNLPDVLWDEGI